MKVPSADLLYFQFLVETSVQQKSSPHIYKEGKASLLIPLVLFMLKVLQEFLNIVSYVAF